MCPLYYYESGLFSGVVEETLKELAGQQVISTRYVKSASDRHERRLDDHGERLARLEVKVG